MIAKRAVIWMFGDCHELHGVVTSLLDARQDLLGKFVICSHLGLLLSHTDMRLIDQQISHFFGVKLLVVPLVGLLGIPELSRVILRHFILHNTRSVGWDTVVPTISAMDVQLVERAVLQQMAIHCLGQEDTPHAVAILVQTQLGTLPRVKITKDKDVVCLGQPLSEPPSRERVIPLPTKVTITVGIIDNRSCLRFDGRHTFQISFMTLCYLIGDRMQPFVLLHHSQHLA